MEASFCVNAMKKAVTAYCKFRMVDTDRHLIVTSSRAVCQICPAQRLSNSVDFQVREGALLEIRGKLVLI